MPRSQRTLPIISFTQNNGQTGPPWSTSLQGRTLSDASPEKSGLSFLGESSDSCCPDCLSLLPILNPTVALPPSPGSWMPLPSLGMLLTSPPPALHPGLLTHVSRCFSQGNYTCHTAHVKVRGHLFPFATWVLEIELRLAGWATSTFTC